MPGKDKFATFKKYKTGPKKMVGSVLVVGGGVSGIQTSLDLVENGFKVYLLDSSPAIGGVMAQLDKTFPTNDCAMCILAPKLVEAGRNLNIDLITLAEILEVKGEPGNFEVKIRRKARYIDPKRCTGCGECARSCPVRAINAYNEGLSLREAIYNLYPQAVPKTYVIDKDSCIGCGLCKNLCLADAVNYLDKDRIEILHVGSIVLNAGFSPFDASLKKEYGWGKYLNVVTSMQYERILSASGPFFGHIQRPSDGKIPTKIAWIQCVGSRDSTVNNEYCSGVCCMYAIKEAVMTKEHESDIEPTIFYMDMRCYGKGFEKYYTNAQNSGIRFIRSRVPELKEDPLTKDIIVKYEKDNELVEERFDLVVLSVGLEVPKGSEKLLDILDVDTNEYGFVHTEGTNPLTTSKDGIFVAGALQGPKDIPESVMQGSAAVSEVSALLKDVRNTLIKEKVYPPEKDVLGQEPRIGVFICHCGINIGAYVDVKKVVEYAKTLPFVVHAEENLYTCSEDTQKKITETIKEKDLNRVVVASCTPRTHEPLFQETLKDAGLNAYLFEMANIREQCSWIHMHDKEGATEKAKDLVRMAVAKSVYLFPLKEMYLPVKQSAVVIGGGVSGMVAALDIARSGYDVTLIEKESELGGKLKELYYDEWGDPQSFLVSLTNKIRTNPKITILTNSKLLKVEGFVGNYKSTVLTPEGEKTIEHGAIIVATGAKEYTPKEYMYGDKNVLTQHKLEEMIAKNEIDFSTIKRIVMIQCVGSRDNEHPYCSRICCSNAMKNAKKILEMNPEIQLFILNKDIRTYGFRENLYSDVRELGGIFLKYTDETKPEVYKNGKNGKKLRVKAYDEILKDWIEIPADLVVLSTGIIPNEENDEIGKLLKIPLNEDKFFLEAHVKLRPVDFATEGIFLAGTAHSPKSVDESIIQAKAAAARALTIISKEKYRAEPTIAAVNEDLCDGCGICEPVCEYKAIEIVQDKDKPEEKKAVVNEAMCKGCGACIAACPSGAMEQKGFTSQQIYALIDAALRPELFVKVGKEE